MESPATLTFRAYYTALRQQCWTDARSNVWGIVATIVLIIITGVLQVEFGLLRTDQTLLTIAVNVGPYLGYLILFLLFHYIRAPWRLASASAATTDAELLSLRRRVEQLTPPKRTPSEEYHYQLAKAALAELGPLSRIVLKHLRAHGKLTFRQSSGYSTPRSVLLSQPPEGMTGEQTLQMLNRCERKSLVSHSEEINVTGTAATITDMTYRIADGMAPALEELLYIIPPGPSVVSSRP
jgi:hypothetical protein